MQKNIIIGIIAILLVGALYVYFFGEKVVIVNAPPKNKKIVFFGDSLVQGVGATAGNDLPHAVGSMMNADVINYGKSGDTTRDALERVHDAIVEDAGIAVVILGGNDVLQKIPKEETFHNLERIITGFQQQGSVVVVFGVRSGVVGDGRGEDYEMLAQKTGSVYMSDILRDVFGKREYMSDAVHPNDAGYAMIAKRLVPVLKDLYDQ